MPKSLNTSDITVVRPGGTVTPFNDNESPLDSWLHSGIDRRDDNDGFSDAADGDNQDVNRGDH